VKKQFNIGDFISIIDDTITGRVLAINGDSVLIEDSDGFERTYTTKEIVVYDSKVLLDDIKLKASLTKNLLIKKAKIKTPTDIIDLHNKNSFLNKNEILENQLKLFKQQLNLAIGKRRTQIVFIHGKGAGILRNELIRILQKNRIKYEKAPYHKFGQGAIEVYLNGVNRVIR
jgi:dsDNA-specific endonuclease/ATPase MutS2